MVFAARVATASHRSNIPVPPLARTANYLRLSFFKG